MMWIYISSLDQVIWLAENWKWAWNLNLFSMTRVKDVKTLDKRVHNLIFLFFYENIDYGYSSEAAWQGASYEYPQYILSWIDKRNVSTFWLKKKSYLELWTSHIFYPLNHVLASLSLHFNAIPKQNLVWYYFWFWIEADEHSTRESIFSTQKVLIFFLFFHENICYGYSLEVLRHFYWVPTTCSHGETKK